MNFPNLERAFSSIELSCNDIDIVINTHEHFGHVGCNKYFYNAAIIFAGKLAAAKITEGDEYATMYGSYSADYKLTKPHIWLEDRAIIDLESFKLEILNTQDIPQVAYVYMILQKTAFFRRYCFCTRHTFSNSTIRKCWRLCKLNGNVQYEEN